MFLGIVLKITCRKDVTELIYCEYLNEDNYKDIFTSINLGVVCSCGKGLAHSK